VAQVGRRSLDSGDLFSPEPALQPHTSAPPGRQYDRARSTLKACRSHTWSRSIPGFRARTQAESGGINVHVYGPFITLNEITWRTSSGQKTFVVEELVVECYRAGASTEI